MDKTATAQSVQHTREKLDGLRIGIEITPEGKERRRPPHLVERDVWTTALAFYRSRGEFFRAPAPYYIDHVDHRLVAMNKASVPLAASLARLGLLGTQPHSKLVTENLIRIAAQSPQRPLHHLSFMSDDAIYLRASATTMIKITNDSITEEHLGTDDVILIADDIADFPSLADLQPHIDQLEPAVGRACTRVLPGLPLSDHLTTRWSTESLFTPSQARQMFLTRYLFTVAASAYPLWPIMFMTGPQGSGKSTASEKILVLLAGRVKEATAFPRRERDLIASATNSSYLVYDNADGIDAAAYDDTLCHISTGAEVNAAKLYNDNVLLTHSLRNHISISARVNPFSRSDVMRRSTVLDVRPSIDQKTTDKARLLTATLEARPAALAELILRARNILRAHIAAGDREYTYQTEMVEYEAFTLRCADYEGTSDETRALWRAHRSQYEDSATSSNPLVYAARLWLGKRGNVSREVSPATLFIELGAIFSSMGQKFSYASPAAFGKHLKTNESALAILGFQRPERREGRMCVFHPSAVEVMTCAKLYSDSMDATGRQLEGPWGSAPDNKNPIDLNDPHSKEEWPNG